MKPPAPPQLSLAEPALWNAAGQPLNLPAAAFDALEWLLWLRDRSGVEMTRAHRVRLRRSVRSLDQQLAAHLPAMRPAPLEEEEDGTGPQITALRPR